MDALALLCTLHADGPTTLARLRQAECISLEHVIAHPTERVARWMRVSVVSAERFQREARGLYERLGPELQSRVDEADEREVHEEREGDRDSGFDRERARAMSLAERNAATAARSSETFATSSGRNSSSRKASALGASAAESSISPTYVAPSYTGTTPGPLPSSLGPSGTAERDPILQRVLDTWRERDEIDSMTDSDVDDVPAALPTPAAELPAIGTQWIDGLDAEASAALSRAGIGTIASLASCEALGVARATGMPYSRVLRFRALARRLNQAEALVDAKVSPSERPSEPRPSIVGTAATVGAAHASEYVFERTTQDEGVGGPFA